MSAGRLIVTIAPPPAIAGWPGVKQQELQLKFAERRLLIEKGQKVDDPEARPLTRTDYVRRGVFCTCLGAALLMAYALLRLEPGVGGVAEARAWCLGLGPLALFFGIGNLIYQRFVPEPSGD